MEKRYSYAGPPWCNASVGEMVTGDGIACGRSGETHWVYKPEGIEFWLCSDPEHLSLVESDPDYALVTDGD